MDAVLTGLGAGFQTALDPFNLMLVLIGCFAGTLVGALPGIGPINGVAILLPIAYGLGLPPESAIILLAGIYYGAEYGGRISSILLNVPGDASAVMTTIDGNPMARNGEAGRALSLSAVASFIGGTFAVILMSLFGPTLAACAVTLMLTLGIPGSGTTAILLGALLLFNVQPGPLMFEQRPEIAWGLIASMYIGNVALPVINLPLVGLFARLLTVPQRYLTPIIAVLAFVGVYSIVSNPHDLYMITLLGVLGWLLRKLGFELAPVILGFVLGALFENNLRRALSISGGDWSILVESANSIVFYAAALPIVLAPLVLSRLSKRRGAVVGGIAPEGAATANAPEASGTTRPASSGAATPPARDGAADAEEDPGR